MRSSINSHVRYLAFVNRVFDQAKARLGLPSDAALARHINDNRSNIAKYRSGERLINDWKLLRLVKEADIEMVEALNFILRHKSMKEDAREVLRTFLDLIKGK